MITTYDVRWGCDVLRPVYDATDGVDGRVSIEVDPRIAHDTDRTVAEAKALWWLVDRPNLFIKIPATMAGLPAITQCLAEGISVNVTLIFSLERYDAGDGRLPRRPGAGPGQRPRPDPHRLGGVVLRLPRRHRDRQAAGQARHRRRPRRCAARPRSPTPGWPTSATRRCSAATGGRRWRRPGRSRSGRCGRPPASRTRRTTTRRTSSSWSRRAWSTRCRRRPWRRSPTTAQIRGDTVRGDYGEAQQVLDRLAALGVDYDDVVQTLEDEGVEKFEDSWNELIEQVTASLRGAGAEVMPAGATGRPARARPRRTAKAPLDEPLSVGGGGSVADAGGSWPTGRGRGRRPAAGGQGPDAVGPGRRAGGGDPARLARPAGDLAGAAPPARRAARAAGGRRLDHVVLAGMGGSSLAPEVISRTAGVELTILDSTDPHQVGAALGDRIERTVVVVSAPSPAARWRPTATAGPPSRPSRRRRPDRGRDRPALRRRSPTRARRWRRPPRRPATGGLPRRPQRRRPLQRAVRVRAGARGARRRRRAAAARRRRGAAGRAGRRRATTRRSPGRSRSARPGTAGRDKLVIADAGSGIVGFGDWAEQLVAESTGKQGKGMLPVVVEGPTRPAPPATTSPWCCWRLARRRRGPDAVASVSGPLGAQFLAWEYATAVAGWVLRINPFDQPNVQESKENTGRILESGPAGRAAGVRRRRGRGLRAGRAARRCDDLRGALRGAARRGPGPRLPRGDGLPRPATGTPPPPTSAAARRGAAASAVTFGWAPRFLHSTGQFHKGGPQTGVFLQVTGAVDGRPRRCPAGRSPSACSGAGRRRPAGARRPRPPAVHLHLTDRSAGLGQLLDGPLP